MTEHLRYEKLKYGNDSKQIYGILFDGAWLWKEYLATILTKCGRLIYPFELKGNEIAAVMKSDSHSFFGLGGAVESFGFPVPQNTKNYMSFTELMRKTETELMSMCSH